MSDVNADPAAVAQPPAAEPPSPPPQAAPETSASAPAAEPGAEAEPDPSKVTVTLHGGPVKDADGKVIGASYYAEARDGWNNHSVYHPDEGATDTEAITEAAIAAHQKSFPGPALTLEGRVAALETTVFGKPTVIPAPVKPAT